MKKSFLFLLAFSMSLILFSVPATPYLLSKIQPDGSVVPYYLNGDEFFSYQTTLDGCLILENTSGFFEYAVMNSDGTTYSLGIQIDNRGVDKTMLQTSSDIQRISFSIRNKRIQTNIRKSIGSSSKPHKYPLKGSPKSLVILAAYSDVSFTIANPQVEYTDLLNKKDYSKNGGVGSAKDYFKACSNGVFDPNFVVVGPYKLPNNQKYYGEPNGTQHDKRASQMVIDACKAANADVDFTEYDTDGDGKIDNVFIYYAGHNEAEGASENTVWPHRFKVYDNIVLDGKQLYDYACTSELSGFSGSRMCGIGTFSHEFGHVLGLPDYYDTSGNRNNPNVPGAWNIMSSGSYNGNGKTPPAYSAEDRFYLGWLKPIQIETGGQYSLESLNTSNSAYLLTTKTSNLKGNNPDPVEYFLLENRQRDGWDTPSTCIAGTGMLITHINYSSLKWRYNQVNNDLLSPGYIVVRADGSSSGRNLAGDPFPGSERVNQFEPILQSGSKLKLPLTNIFEIAGHITFSVAGGDGRGLNLSNIAMNLVAPYSDASGSKVITPQFAVSKLVGKRLLEPVEIYFENETDFTLKQEDGTYSTSKRIVPLVKDSVDIDIEIQFNPSFINCSKNYSDRLIIKSGNYMRAIELSGTTPRNNILQVPVLEEATNISNNSFDIKWNSIDDAEYYFVSIDEVDEEAKSFLEKFDNFGKVEFGKIWKSNFTTTSKLSPKSEPVAVWFRNNKDQLTSPVYHASLTRLSYWLRSNSAVGNLVIEAKEGIDWDTIAVQNIKESTLEKVYSYDLKEGNQYSQFRMTYLTEGVGSGISFDDFNVQASLTKTPIVIRQKIMQTSYSATRLSSGKIYYASIEAAENKGCAMHFSPKSNIQRVQMSGGNSNSNSKLSISYGKDQSILEIANYDAQRDVNKRIVFYDMQGHLVKEITVESSTVIIPQLLRGNVYLAVYTSMDGISDNASHISFYY